MNILGLDPGKVNFGYSLIQVEDDIYTLKTLGCLKSPINDLKNDNFTPIYTRFVGEIKRLVKGDTRIRMERFQSRGFGGDTIELVGVMIGTVKTLFPKAPFSLNTAAQWKHWVNKNEALQMLTKNIIARGKRPSTLDKLYVKMKPYCTPHEVDATLMAIFEFHTYLGIPPFQHFTRKDWSYFVTAIKNCKYSK